MNTADWILLVLILAALILAGLGIRKRRKNGRGCCGSCSGCAQGCKDQKK